MALPAEWIAVDWGTTHLRAWAMQGETVVAEASSARGMGSLDPTEFEPALLELIADWLAPTIKTRVICCGMVGSRQGWQEAPYRAVPCSVAAQSLTAAPVDDSRISVHLLSGLSQSTPADVMRGEETQIAGFLHRNPGWDGVICLPGTHSKWVQVSADEVVSFQTFLTGEMFSLLAGHSVLRHSIPDAGWDTDAFAEALSDAMSKPESVSSRLFRLRANDLLHGASPDTARATLSGLLIGTELAAARPYWLGQQVAVIGADQISQAYVTALELQGMHAIHARADAMTLSGLIAAHKDMKATA